MSKYVVIISMPRVKEFSTHLYNTNQLLFFLIMMAVLLLDLVRQKKLESKWENLFLSARTFSLNNR